MPFFTKLILPDYVYHGTIAEFSKSFAKQPINFRELGNSINKDFGTGLYTTIDPYQATVWAKKLTKDLALEPNFINADVTPCVVAIRIKQDNYMENVEILDFRGESRLWSNFVLNHRIGSSLHNCTCAYHPQIVCGSMADNNTSGVIEEFIDQSRDTLAVEDQLWFQNRITYKDSEKRVLTGLELGDQIAFFDEKLNKMLSVVGFCFFDKQSEKNIVNSKNFWKEWVYHVEFNQQISI